MNNQHHGQEAGYQARGTGYQAPQTGYYPQQSAYAQQPDQQWQQQPYYQQPAQPQHEGASGLKGLAVVVMILGLIFLAYSITMFFTIVEYKGYFTELGSAFDISFSLGMFFLATILKLCSLVLAGILFFITGAVALAAAGNNNKIKAAKTFGTASLVTQLFALLFAVVTVLVAFVGKSYSLFDLSISIWDSMEGMPERVLIFVELGALALLGLIFISILVAKLSKMAAAVQPAYQGYYYGQAYQSYGQQPYYGQQQYPTQPQYPVQQQTYPPQQPYMPQQAAQMPQQAYPPQQGHTPQQGHAPQQEYTPQQDYAAQQYHPPQQTEEVQNTEPQEPYQPAEGSQENIE